MYLYNTQNQVVAQAAHGFKSPTSDASLKKIIVVAFPSTLSYFSDFQSYYHYIIRKAFIEFLPLSTVNKREKSDTNLFTLAFLFPGQIKFIKI